MQRQHVSQKASTYRGTHYKKRTKAQKHKSTKAQKGEWGQLSADKILATSTVLYCKYNSRIGTVQTYHTADIILTFCVQRKIGQNIRGGNLSALPFGCSENVAKRLPRPRNRAGIAPKMPKIAAKLKDLFFVGPQHMLNWSLAHYMILI